MVAVVDYICHHSSVSSLHMIGHSMGGMISMALLAHPTLHVKVASVVALGSSIFLQNSIFGPFNPLLPLLKVVGGLPIDQGSYTINIIQIPPLMYPILFLFSFKFI